MTSSIFSTAPVQLIAQADIDEVLGFAKNSRVPVQCLFNQGKYVYESLLMDFDSKHLWFDFNGIERSSLFGSIDFYAPVVFVFFHEGRRYQFTTKQVSLQSAANGERLQVRMPDSVMSLVGRTTQRHELPSGSALLHAMIDQAPVSMPIREMSLGGLSVWSDQAHGLTPHSTIKQAYVEFSDGLRIPCSIRIVRINYSLSADISKSLIISCQFTSIPHKEQQLLQTRLQTFV